MVCIGCVHARNVLGVGEKLCLPPKGEIYKQAMVRSKKIKESAKMQKNQTDTKQRGGSESSRLCPQDDCKEKPMVEKEKVRKVIAKYTVEEGGYFSIGTATLRFPDIPEGTPLELSKMVDVPEPEICEDADSIREPIDTRKEVAPEPERRADAPGRRAMKHSPEPWVTSQPGADVFAKIAGTNKTPLVADCQPGIPGTVGVTLEHIANAQRIVACVNAMAGIEDPEAFVKHAVLYCKSLDEMLAFMAKAKGG